jgi:FkbM family methyltransferase
MTAKVWNHPANKHRRIRQLWQAVAVQCRGRLLGRATVVRIGERSRLLATLDNGPTVLAAYAREPDYPEWQVWKKILRDGDVFIDVGANVGIYTVLALEAGARVIAVEPDPENVRRLRANLELNNRSAEVWPFALSDKHGILNFSSTSDPARNHLSDAGDVEVRVEALDTQFAHGHARGMKIDVEGAERKVLEGCARALSEGRIDVIQLEWNETARLNFGETREPVARLLGQAGYRLFRPTLDGTLVPTTAKEGSDVFAVREGLPELGRLAPSSS